MSIFYRRNHWIPIQHFLSLSQKSEQIVASLIQGIYGPPTLNEENNDHLLYECLMLACYFRTIAIGSCQRLTNGDYNSTMLPKLISSIQQTESCDKKVKNELKNRIKEATPEIKPILQMIIYEYDQVGFNLMLAKKKLIEIGFDV